MATLLSTRRIVMSSNNFDRKTVEKRAQNDLKKVNKGFKKINDETKLRGQEASDSLKTFFETLDKVARKDVDKLQKFFDEPDVEVVEADGYEEIDNIIVFKTSEDADA